MKYKTILIILIFSLTSFSQKKTISITGEIRNELNKELPFANIYLKNNNIGTISNSEGSFILNIPIEKQTDTIVISYMGYNNKELSIINFGKKNRIITLLKETEILSEISISANFDWRKYISKAIKKIPDNYPQKDIEISSFYREILLNNNTPVRLAESANTIHYKSYSDKFNRRKSEKKYYNDYLPMMLYHQGYPIMRYKNNKIINPDDVLYINECRTSEDNSITYTDFDICEGPLGMFAVDEVKYPTLILNNKMLRKYHFSLEDVTTIDNQPINIISFKPKNKIKNILEGKLYINTNNLAFVKIIFNYTDNCLNNIKEYDIYRFTNQYYTKPITDKLKKTKYNLQINYKCFNEKYFINFIKIESTLKYTYQDKDTTYNISSIQTMNINKIDSIINDINNIVPFNFANENKLFYYPISYNESFWKNYNLIPKDKYIENLIYKLDSVKSIDNQFKEKFSGIKNMQPPIAKIVADTSFVGKNTVIDNYRWIENRDNIETKKYIEEENSYVTNFTLDIMSENRKIANQLKSYNKNDSIINNKRTKFNNSEYWVGNNNWRILRKKNNTIDTIFNIKNLQNITEINSFKVNEKHLLISCFSKTMNKPILIVYNINKTLIDTLINNVGIYEIFEDNIYYTNLDSINMPSSAFKYNVINKTIKLVYAAEKNYFLQLVKSISKQYIFINEYNNERDLSYTIIHKNKIKKIDVSKYNFGANIEHVFGDTFYIASNYKNINYSIFKTNINNLEPEKWELLYKSKFNAAISFFSYNKEYCILKERKNVNEYFTFIRLIDNKISYKHFKEEVYSLNNIKIRNNVIEYSVSTPISPNKYYTYNIINNSTTFIKQDKINGFNTDSYITKRVYVKTAKGVKVPLTLIYSKKLKNKKSHHPVFIEAYGAYSYSYDCPFDKSFIPLLNKGFIVAFAHVRGGGELGEQWHLDGIKENKKNAYFDFIACTEYLINKKYTNKNKIVAFGRSAGGIIMGGVANLRPDLYKLIILEYPFLDISTGVAYEKDESIEFGKIPEEFKMIQNYSPYSNISKQNYPTMLFISGLSDINVPYWHPTKHVARIRHLNNDSHNIFLKTYNGGHSGYGIADDAFKYSFIYKVLGIL